MKILYAGDLSAGSSCLYRMMALQRLGHTLIGFNSADYEVRSSWLRPIAYRLATGTHAYSLNQDLLTLITKERPDLFWSDKLLLLRPDTLRHINAINIKTVSYMIDNAFGPRQDPGWRLYLKEIPLFDLHITQRDVSLRDYVRNGARNVMKVQTAFEPTVHYPPSVAINDDFRRRGVSFIGSPYDRRGEIVTLLAQAGVPITVSGNSSRWRHALGKSYYKKIFRSGELYEKDYRESIWDSKINLSFLTHSNQDEYAHKSFEIAGCGGFLLAERSEGHSVRFVEDREAVFFSGGQELIEKIACYLPDAAARACIARAGYERAVQDGYYNDVQMGKVISRVECLSK